MMYHSAVDQSIGPHTPARGNPCNAQEPDMSQALAMTIWAWIGVGCVALPLVVIGLALLHDKQRDPRDPPVS
jgi:hypothetical protein